MSFESEFKAFMPHRLLLEAVDSYDQYHRPSYGTVAEFVARVVAKETRTADLEGRERIGTHVAWIAPDTTGALPTIRPDARVTLPDGAQFTVLAVESYPDETGAPHALPSNLVANPYIASASTDWSAGGTNTVARDASRHMVSNASLLATYQDSLVAADYDIGTTHGVLTAAEYIWDGWVWIPTAYSGAGNLSPTVTGLTSVTLGTVVASDADLRNRWQRVSARFTPDAGDVAGAFLRLNHTQAPTADDEVWIDNVRLLLFADFVAATSADHHMKLILGATGRTV